MKPPPDILVLAAGRDHRMRSDLPKVLHPVLFRPMVHYVLDAAAAVPNRSVAVVIGCEERVFRAACGGYAAVRTVQQNGRDGTGAAVLAAEPALREAEGPVLVLSGDVVMLNPASLERMLTRLADEGAACVLGTTALGNPRGYGRVLRRLDGTVTAVREEADCSPPERLINEVNAGVYCFERRALLETLPRVAGAAGGRTNLPDVVATLAAAERKVVTHSFGDPREVMGIDDRYALWQAEAALQEKVNRALMKAGVTLQDPRSTWVDTRTRVGHDVRIEGGSVIIDSVVEPGAVIESHCRVEGSALGAGCRVRQGSCIKDSRVGPACEVGPYAHLRPGSVVVEGSRVGTFTAT